MIAPFNAAAWLARFERQGGRVWFGRDGKLRQGWTLDTEQQALAAREIYREIEAQPERIAMIRDRLARAQ